MLISRPSLVRVFDESLSSAETFAERPHDRNDQVSKMGAIFKAASGVIVWLGHEAPGTAAAMELPKRVKRFWPSLYSNPNELTDHSRTPPECPRWGEGAWPAFISLLTRPWFRRLWVIQEVVCARDIVVTCGTVSQRSISQTSL